MKSNDPNILMGIGAMDQLANCDPRVVVYSRQGCHLCEQVGDMLARCGITPTWVDIDADPELLERYDHCVPVVDILGRTRFRGQVNELLLRRILHAELGVDR